MIYFVENHSDPPLNFNDCWLFKDSLFWLPVLTFVSCVSVGNTCLRLALPLVLTGLPQSLRPISECSPEVLATHPWQDMLDTWHTDRQIDSRGTHERLSRFPVKIMFLVCQHALSLLKKNLDNIFKNKLTEEQHLVNLNEKAIRILKCCLYPTSGTTESSASPRPSVSQAEKWRSFFSGTQSWSLFRQGWQMVVTVVWLRSKYRNYMSCFQILRSGYVTAFSSYFALCVTIQRIFPSPCTGIHLGLSWVFKNTLF